MATEDESITVNQISRIVLHDDQGDGARIVFCNTGKEETLRSVLMNSLVFDNFNLKEKQFLKKLEKILTNYKH